MSLFFLQISSLIAESMRDAGLSVISLAGIKRALLFHARDIQTHVAGTNSSMPFLLEPGSCAISGFHRDIEEIKISHLSLLLFASSRLLAYRTLLNGVDANGNV